MNNSINKIDEEIKLSDLIKTIWERRLIINIGIFITVLSVLILSFLQPKTFESKIVIMFSNNSSENNATQSCQENLSSIKQLKYLIESGYFNNALLKRAKYSTEEGSLAPFKFSVSTLTKTNLLQITSQSNSYSFCKDTLISLYNILETKYNFKLREQIKTNIETYRIKINKLSAITNSLLETETYLENELSKLSNELNVINSSNNTNKNIASNNSLKVDHLQLNNEKDLFQYRKSLEKFIFDYKLKISDIKIKIIHTNDDLSNYHISINELRHDLVSTKKIELITGPPISAKPIKPNIKINFILSLVGSTLLMIISVFLYDFVLSPKN
jgi:capsular polysaccharide biosynthesis protein